MIPELEELADRVFELSLTKGKTKIERGDCKMLYTFNEWNNKGFRILKGAKAIRADKQGKALFSSDQVYIPTDKEFDEIGIYGVGTDEYFSEEIYGRND